MRIDCHVPITLRIAGVPTEDQLAALGRTLARAVAARLAEAERLLADRHGIGDGGVVVVRERYDPAREASDGYAVPSYDHEGTRTAVPVFGGKGISPMPRDGAREEIAAKIREVIGSPGMKAGDGRADYQADPARAEANLYHTHFRDDAERLSYALGVFRAYQDAGGAGELFDLMAAYELRTRSRAAAGHAGPAAAVNPPRHAPGSPSAGPAPRPGVDPVGHAQHRIVGKPPAGVRVFPFPGQAKWRLLFPAPVTRQEVETWFFAGAGLPDGFGLTAEGPGGAAPGPVWYLSWADFRSRHPQDSIEFTRAFQGVLTPYGQALAYRAMLGGDATDDEVAAWEASQREKKRRSGEYDRQFVPSLGMTRGEAFARLPWGPYEVRGEFVWIGIESPRSPAVVQTWPLSSNEVFNRDMRFYLRHGLSVNQAVAAFNEQWDYILGIELAFAGVGAGYRTSTAEAAELESESGLVGRRLAKEQGFLSTGDLALAKAMSSPGSVVLRTEVVEQAEIGAVRRAVATESASTTNRALPGPVPPASAATPGRRIGFVTGPASPQAPAGGAAVPPAGRRPIAGFGRDLEPLAPSPPPTPASEIPLAPAKPPIGFRAPDAAPPVPKAETLSPRVAGFGRPVEPPPPGVPGPGPAHRLPPARTVQPGAGEGKPVISMSADKPSPGRQLTEWEKNGKVTGNTDELRRRLESGDPEAQAEFEDVQEEIATGGKPHIEPYRQPPARRAGEKASERISTSTKSELENSGWLKKRLPAQRDRRAFMDWLKARHKQGIQGDEVVAGRSGVDGHDHYPPGAPETEEMVREWEREMGRRK
jgi:hypothetical protein